jgi:uncharacterized protein
MTFEFIYLPIQFLFSNFQNSFGLENIFVQNLSFLVLQLPQFSLSIPLTFIIIFLSIVSAITVGFSLGLIGGGGSILAVPLLVYVIRLEPHIAIGTSSLAVAVNALINILYHKKEGHIFFKRV